MSYDDCKICPLCAWRGSCAKRFSRGEGSPLHCPDFSEDVTLRQRAEAAADGPINSSGKTQP